MSNLISQTDLQKLYTKERKDYGIQGIESIIESKRNTEKEYKKKRSVFLCHAHQDKTVVNNIILLFNKVDVNFYVDWMDSEMPKITDKNTAAVIRRKIEHNNRFLFLATAAGLASKWCSWELGLAYSIKNIDELAILPIESKSGIWKGNEYLNLYPHMQIQEKDFEKIDVNAITIKRDERKLVTLEEWLTF